MSDSESLKPEKRASGAQLALFAWALFLGHGNGGQCTEGSGFKGGRIAPEGLGLGSLMRHQPRDDTM